MRKISVIGIHTCKDIFSLLLLRAYTYIYIYIERERERYIHRISIHDELKVRKTTRGYSGWL